MADDEIEIETSAVRLRREDAARRLHDIADQLASRNGVDLEVRGRAIFVKVPDELELSVEIERKPDGGELEIELRW